MLWIIQKFKEKVSMIKAKTNRIVSLKNSYTEVIFPAVIIDIANNTAEIYV